MKISSGSTSFPKQSPAKKCATFTRRALSMKNFQLSKCYYKNLPFDFFKTNILIPFQIFQQNKKTTFRRPRQNLQFFRYWGDIEGYVIITARNFRQISPNFDLGREGDHWTSNLTDENLVQGLVRPIGINGRYCTNNENNFLKYNFRDELLDL